MPDFCPKCNAMLPPGLEECPRCGKLLADEDKAALNKEDIFKIRQQWILEI